MKRVAVIDFGSNAIRLKIAEIQSASSYKVLEKIRFPVRIGTDVFLTGEVSLSKVDEVLEVFRKFKSHLAHFQVEEVQAVATSALRDAKNANLIIKKIEDHTNIKIKIITGLEEAELIYRVIIHELPILAGKTLLIDIGGGSTELSFINEGILETVQSFNVGTIRMPKDNQNEMPRLLEAICSFTKGQKIHLIGTGGNLRRLGKLRKKMFDRLNSSIIHKNEVFVMYDHIKDLTPLFLMKKYGLKHDRAEVIVPALQIFTTILNEVDIDIIDLPKIGLADSLILSISSCMAN